MTDHWPQLPTGVPLTGGYEIGFCYCTAGVTEGYAVKVGTHATGKVPVTVSAGVGDGIGIVLKTETAGNYAPVLFYGAIKLDTSSNVTIGDIVMGASGGATVMKPTFITTSPATLLLKAFGSNSYLLGMAMQTATSGDEIVVLVGKVL